MGIINIIADQTMTATALQSKRIMLTMTWRWPPIRQRGTRPSAVNKQTGVVTTDDRIDDAYLTKENAKVARISLPPGSGQKSYRN
jgi:hypothetical protein